MKGPALATINVRMTLLSNDTNRHEDTSTSYAKVVNHVAGRYAANTSIVKADENIDDFKQSSLTL